MNVNSLSALNAYRNQLKMQEGLEEGTDAVSDGKPKGSFAQLVEEAAKDTAGSQYQSEATQLESLTSGKVDLSDLVTAVANAELTLTTVVAIRDRVINAYQDIIRMPI